MPTYSYRCQLCGEVADHVVSIAQRHDSQECLRETCEGRADFQFAAPRSTHAREVPEQGVIWSEKQLDRGWRNKGTTGQPGGAGRTLHFDQKR